MRDKYFCSQGCESNWLNQHMENIEHGRPIEFIRHRRESQGYQKVRTKIERVGKDLYNSRIERVDNRTELD